MTNLEKRFLMDARFSGVQKIICLLVWANEFHTSDQMIMDATGFSLDRINGERDGLVKLGIIVKYPNKYECKPLSFIYSK